MQPSDDTTSFSSSRLPRWVRAADTLAVLLGLVSLSVVVFGGFRVWIGDARLSVTDWVRPAVAALVLVGLRHFKYRTPLLPVRIGAGLRAWWTSPDTRTVLPIHLATRLGILAVGFLAVVLVGTPPNVQVRWEIYGNALLDLPARWDTGWYLGIANEGYNWSPRGPNAQQNIAFFPAYPMLMRYASIILGRQPIWTGVAISLVAFFWALLYFLRLSREHLGDDDRAATSVLLLASYPFALFFSAAYTESLFLLTTVAAVYHFRRDEIWRAAAWGAVAGLTRPNGAFLSIVLGLMVIEPFWAERRRARAGGAGLTWGRHIDRLAAAAAPGIGMLVYSTYVMFLTGNPFQWAAQNAAWGRVYRSLDTVVTDRVQYVSEHGLYGYASSQALDMFYLASVVFMLALVWPVFRRFGAPYAVLILVNLLAPIAAGGLLSIGRVTAVLFPAFLWLGAVIPARHRGAWVAVFACLQGFAAVMFFTWRPLY